MKRMISCLRTAVMLMARLQPTYDKAENVPSYDAKAVSQVHASSKVHEKVSHGKRNTVIQTTNDDQIDSNIIFDYPFVENNGSMSEHDSNAHNEYHEIQMLAYNSILTIHMLGKKPNKVYESFQQDGLGYLNPKRLKKVIAAQPKMYDGDSLHSNKLVINSPNSDETLEDAEQS
ncbi:hypothetical protein Tco_1207100 [Tanacetum coccineum]